jgi:hypothetical protein
MTALTPACLCNKNTQDARSERSQYADIALCRQKYHIRTSHFFSIKHEPVTTLMVLADNINGVRYSALLRNDLAKWSVIRDVELDEVDILGRYRRVIL